MIIKCCYDISSYLNIDINKCFVEVHRLNMTKVCPTEDEAIETVKWYKQNEHRYESPSYRKSVNPKYWVVFDEKTSKILKSIKYEKPNLGQFITN